jgi:hypothetical protein
MANIKISELPAVTSLSNSDVFPSVASSTTSKITLKNLANTLPQVTSSISASFATTSSFAISASWAPSENRINTGSFITTGSNSSTQSITGSLSLSGSVYMTGSLILTKGISANYIYPLDYNGKEWRNPLIMADQKPGFVHFYPSSTNGGGADDGTYTYYFADVNLGQAMQSNKAGVIKFSRDFASVPDTKFYTLISDGVTVSDFLTTQFGYNTFNGQYHILTVTGSFRSIDNTSLGSKITSNHYITGSVQATGSYTQNGFTILTRVSMSLNFADDTAAAAGGVPLGGLYRNGNVIAIRIA